MQDAHSASSQQRSAIFHRMESKKEVIEFKALFIIRAYNEVIMTA